MAATLEGKNVILLHCTDEFTTLRTGDRGRVLSDSGNAFRVRFESGLVETLVRSAGDAVSVWADR